MADGDPRLQLVIDLARAEIGDQFAGAVGLDGIAIGILLFDSALAGSIIAAANIPSSPLDGSWVYPLAGLVGSAIFAFVGATIGRVKAGPRLAEFDTETQLVKIEDAQAIAKTRLLATIKKNQAVVQRKETALGFALVLLALTLVGYGLYAGRDLLGAVLSGSVNLLALMWSHGQLAGVLIVVCLAVVMVFIYAREG